jgi:hypothetical protein
MRTVQLTDEDLALVRAALTHKIADAEDLAARALRQSVSFPDFAEHAHQQLDLAVRYGELLARLDVA